MEVQTAVSVCASNEMLPNLGSIADSGTCRNSADPHRSGLEISGVEDGLMMQRSYS